MRKMSILLIALLVVSVLLVGCSGSKESSSITGKATVDTSSADDSADEPAIDTSYNTRSSEPTTTTTRTTTTTQTTTSALSDEDRAKQVATEYIKKLPGYRDFNGRNIQFKTVTKNSGDGNYLVDATFIRNPIGSDYAREEPINVHLTIRKWKGDSYTFN